ncbi:hypothetical protein [Micromonospora sp. NBS 11-29]|uniref:hypothetical protein n=1 Tax=Micromonospora sp. NBS 11-29 TaxID=1960879 RepID=UPI0020CCDD17|nr:hypothetical protein [Micromonospora sp. NBS 11-29]
MTTDRYAWHRDYDQPDSASSRRLTQVRPRVAEEGFVPVAVTGPAEGVGVGAHRFTGRPRPLATGARIFQFDRTEQR